MAQSSLCIHQDVERNASEGGIFDAARTGTSVARKTRIQPPKNITTAVVHGNTREAPSFSQTAECNPTWKSKPTMIPLRIPNNETHVTSTTWILMTMP